MRVHLTAIEDTTTTLKLTTTEPLLDTSLTITGTANFNTTP